MKYSLIAPTRIVLPRKTKADKVIPINLNWYRNAHYQVSNQAKKIYKQSMTNQIMPLPMFGSISISMTYFSKTKQKSDIDNWCSVNNKFFQDALVELGKLEEDNYLYVPKVSYSYGGLDPRKQGYIEITIKELK